MSKKTKPNTEIVAEYRQGSRYHLAALVQELDRQRNSRLDFVADSRHFKFGFDGNSDGASALRLLPDSPIANEWLDQSGVLVNAATFAQVCGMSETAMPVDFARKLMVSQPDLGATILTELWHREPKQRLIRLLDGKVRAVLSDKYRVLDNLDMALSALDVAKDNGAEPIECNLTDRLMRLKLVSKSVWDSIDVVQRSGNSWYAGGLGNQEFLSKVAAKSGGELPGGSGTVWPCVTISNSETGHGGLNVRIGILAGICFNLATVETVASRVHLGGRLDEGVYSLETQQADSKAIMLAIRDAIKAAFTPEHFRKIVAQVNATGNEAVAAPTAAVGHVVEGAGVSDGMRDKILEHFLRDYAPNRYGLAQAVARASQDTESPDEADELETLAGGILAGSVALA